MYVYMYVSTVGLTSAKHSCFEKHKLCLCNSKKHFYTGKTYTNQYIIMTIVSIVMGSFRDAYSLLAPPTRTRQDCLVLSRPSFQFPIKFSAVLNIFESGQLRIGNKKLSFLVAISVHTADTDKTRRDSFVLSLSAV